MSTKTAQAGVDFIRDEVKRMALTWQLMRDSMAGQPAIKERGIDYLPMPNADDSSEPNQKRYAALKTRAMYYPVTQRTAKGFVGQIFQKNPVFTFPTEMKTMHTNADGAGNTALQFSKALAFEILTTGRAGILADFPDTGGREITKRDVDTGRIHPTLKMYVAEDVINWRVTVIGAVKVLTMVVLREGHTVADGDFGFSTATKYRVLKFANVSTDPAQPVLGVVAELWSQAAGATVFTVEKTALLKDVAGRPLETLPFWFVGAEDNEPSPNQPPLLGLAYINIGHYRNSADVEQSAYLVGSPTLVVSGMNKEWLRDELKGAVRLGSATGLPLPPACTAELLQCEPNSLARELMKDKEQQMVALGAQLVEQKEVQQTATESSQKESGKLSVLSTIVHNINAALANGLKMCASFIVNRELTEGENPELVAELSTDFSVARMSSADRAQLIAEWQGGAITFEEMRTGLKAAGIAYEDDDKARDAIDTELANSPTNPLNGDGAKKDKNTPPAA